MENDTAFYECYLYFIDDVWNLMVHEEICEAEVRGLSEREVLARYMASWIPWEPDSEKIISGGISKKKTGEL